MNNYTLITVSCHTHLKKRKYNYHFIELISLELLYEDNQYLRTSPTTNPFIQLYLTVQLESGRIQFKESDIGQRSRSDNAMTVK